MRPIVFVFAGLLIGCVGCLSGTSPSASSPSGKKYLGFDSRTWLERYKDLDPEIRSNAGNALVTIGDDYAIAGLIATMKEDSPQNAAETAGFLGQIGPKAKAAIPEIEKLRKNPALKSDLQGLVVSIGRIRGDFVPDTPTTFMKVLQTHKDADFRLAAALLLDCDAGHEAKDGWEKDCKARLPVLRNALRKETDERVRERLKKAIAYLEKL